MSLGCVLLAAGSGRRFGGDKLTHLVEGVSMLERALRLYSGQPYAIRTLVCRPGDAFVAELGARYGFVVVENHNHQKGIGTSAAKGMETLVEHESHLTGAMFGVCDQPYLTAETVERLMARFQEEPDCIVAPQWDGKRGNPVIFPKAVFSEFLELDGDVGGGAVLARHLELLRLVPVSGQRELEDVDTKGQGLD